MRRNFSRRKKKKEAPGESPPPPEVSGVEVFVVSGEKQGLREESQDAEYAKLLHSEGLLREEKESVEEQVIVTGGVPPQEPLMGLDIRADLSEKTKKSDISFPEEGPALGKTASPEPQKENIPEAGQEPEAVIPPQGEKEGGSIDSSAGKEGEQTERDIPETPKGEPSEGGAAGYYYPFPYPPYAQPPYTPPYYQGFWQSPTGEKRGKSRRRAAHEPAPIIWGVPWWLPPVVPPVMYPPYPGQTEPMRGDSTFFAIPEEHASIEGFQKLAGEEGESKRIDLKWLFGVTSSLILFIALVVSSLFIITAPGNAKRINAGILKKASLVREVIDDNYLELRSKARRKPQASFLIPDLGIDIFLKGQDIGSLDSEELTEKVITLMARNLYSEGYSAGIPFTTPRGAGEERGKAVCITILSALNGDSHKGMLIPLAIIASVGIAMGLLSVVFSVSWGRVITTALVLVCASFPVSFISRFFTEFVLTGGTGTYKDATHTALRTALTSSIYVFDACLGAGALLLLVGVIGAVVSRKRTERVPPFLELKTTPDLSEEFMPAAPVPEEEPGLTPGIEGTEEEPGKESPGL